ncbi:MAG: C25 family cysteine peptidase, partial [Bacteroidales bacterium]|nr:C25 family cysteine peptidase [Bacteroidales bacterium]
MKQKFLLLISFFAIFFIQDILANGDIQKKYTFEYPVLEKQTDGFYKIIYKNLRNSGAAGTPLLPYYAADILLPQGSELFEVEIIDVIYYKEEENIQIIPASKPLPLSRIDDTQSSVSPDEKIYRSVSRYPEKAVGKLQTQYLGGYSVGGFSICPVAYFPALKKVRFIKSITINIKTQKTEESTYIGQKTNSRPDFLRKIQRVVDNPKAISRYQTEREYNDETDLLLITSQDLLSSFQEYIDFKKSQGFLTEALTTEDIYSTYDGQDNPEKIRNAIIDYYQNKNLQYVILGGDADGAAGEDVIVPARGLSASAGGETDNNIPADIYYSGLDGTWDSNGNGIFGEADEFDIMAEVYVGRFSVDNAAEVANVTNKHIKYQDEPVIEDITKALMVGELLWTDPDTYGGDYKDEIVEGSSNHGYTTAGFTDDFSIAYLYERDESWTINDVFNEFNNTGINIINHLGHSNVTYNMTMYNSSVNTTNFTNDGIERGFVFEYSQGCYCGSFDNRSSYGSYGTEDCFAEAITSLETGLVATIMNSRYGWGMKGSTDGASQYFDREFFDAIFNENMFTLGEANADSKEDNLSNLDESVMRWCAYETNLLGDPSMYLWTENPGVITAGYTTGIALGASQLTFTTDAPDARIGLIQNGELIGRGITDQNGDLVLDLFNPVSAVDPISVSIIAPNKLRHLGTINVYTNQPYVVLSGYTLDDVSGNNNNEADYNETISLDVTLENVSDSYEALNVHDSLYCNDPYITLTDSLESYGSIAAEGT